MAAVRVRRKDGVGKVPRSGSVVVDRERTPRRSRPRRTNVITLGVILLILGLVLNIGILSTLGVILLVIGAVLFLLGTAGRAVGGRRHYY